MEARRHEERSPSRQRSTGASRKARLGATGGSAETEEALVATPATAESRSLPRRFLRVLLRPEIAAHPTRARG